MQIVPASAYSDTQTSFSLIGENFRPPVEVDTYSGAAGVVPAPYQISLEPTRPIAGRRSVPAMSPTWHDQSRIDAVLPAGLPAGIYTVDVRDATGQPILPALTFSSLGPDIDPPRIVFLQPAAASAVRPGEQVVVVARIDDGAGRPLSAQGSVSSPGLDTQTLPPCVIDDQDLCAFAFTAPDTGSLPSLPIDIRVDAQDSLHNASTGYLSIFAAPAPTITSVVPDQGSTLGNTSITVSGQGFIGGRWQIMIDGVPIRTVSATSRHTIQSITAAHVPGGATVTVSNGDSTTNGYGFTFIPPPILKLVDPPSRSRDATNPDRRGRQRVPAETQFYWIQAGGDGSHQVIPLASDPNHRRRSPTSASSPNSAPRSTCSPGQARSPSARTIRCREIRSCSTRSRSVPRHEAAVQAHAAVAGSVGHPPGDRRLLVAAHRPGGAARCHRGERAHRRPAGGRSCRRRPAAPVVDPARRRAHLRSHRLRAGRSDARGAAEVPAAGLSPERRLLRHRAVRRAWLRHRASRRTWRTRAATTATAITSRCAPSTSNRWG